MVDKLGKPVKKVWVYYLLSKVKRFAESISTAGNILPYNKDMNQPGA